MSLKQRLKASCAESVHAAEVLHGRTGSGFTDRIREIVTAYPSGMFCTVESIRLDAEARGVTPLHQHSWGSSIGRVLRSGLVVQTGCYVNPISRWSPVGKKPEYQRV